LVSAWPSAASVSTRRAQLRKSIGMHVVIGFLRMAILAQSMAQSWAPRV
jgi:hypothetical protein